MRYNVHQPRAFRNRIAKSIGVLVAAALVATLGLPSAAQAQAIGATGVVFADGGDSAGLTVTWSTRLNTTDVNDWIVTFTRPNGMKVVLNSLTTPTPVPALDNGSTETATLNQKDLGTWWVQVDACFMPLGTTGAAKGVCPSGQLESGTAVGYTHGPPAAPENLAASMVPGGVALTWKVIMGDRGIVDYQYSLDGKAWKPAAASGAMVVKVDPGEYTFMVRARGSSDNDLNTMQGATAEDAESNGAAASVDITVPMTTPTLPEIAALLLAMLLLGSGAYLLRRRQSGGLTRA